MLRDIFCLTKFRFRLNWNFRNFNNRLFLLWRKLCKSNPSSITQRIKFLWRILRHLFHSSYRCICKFILPLENRIINFRNRFLWFVPFSVLKFFRNEFVVFVKYRKQRVLLNGWLVYMFVVPLQNLFCLWAKPFCNLLWHFYF